MISVISSGISIYNPISRAGQPALTQVEAVLAAENTKQLARELAQAKAVEDARQKFLQTQYVGPARTVARSTALGSERPQPLQTQYVGLARSAARLAALGQDKIGATDMQNYYQDLRSGCHVGPKPASIIAAEERARLVLNITV
ncbi:MAG: hypothetical protein COB16_05615 [Rhodobacteraceae bacterium]|nr:MAG: hypothetical protein COB16_05615 [Paracoccaceae bacterium]